MSILSKSGIQGSLTAVASGALFGFTTRINFGPSSMYLLPYTFLVGAGSAILADVAGKLVHEELHVNEKAESEIALALGTCLSGLIFYSALKVIQPQSAEEIGFTRAILIGGGAEYLASLGQNLIQT